MQCSLRSMRFTLQDSKRLVMEPRIIMNTSKGRVFKFKYDSKEKTEYGQCFTSSQHIALST